MYEAQAHKQVREAKAAKQNETYGSKILGILI